MPQRTIGVHDRETPEGVELIFFEIGAKVFILKPGGMATTTFIDCLRFLIDPPFQQANPDLLTTGNFLQDLLPYLDNRTANSVTSYQVNDTTGDGHLTFVRSDLPEKRPDVYAFIGSPVTGAMRAERRRARKGGTR